MLSEVVLREESVGGRQIRLAQKVRRRQICVQRLLDRVSIDALVLGDGLHLSFAVEFAHTAATKLRGLREELTPQFAGIQGGALVELARIGCQLEKTASKPGLRRGKCDLAPGFQQSTTRKPDVRPQKFDSRARQLSGTWPLGLAERHHQQLVAPAANMDEISGKQRGPDASYWSWIRWFLRSPARKGWPACPRPCAGCGQGAA